MDEVEGVKKGADINSIKVRPFTPDKRDEERRTMTK